MKKFLSSIILSCFFVIFTVENIFAHPLDISSSVFSLGKSTISGMTYFHSYEVGVLLGKRGINILEVSEYNNYKPEILDYFRTNFSVSNNGQECEILHLDIPDKEGYEILTRGLEIQYTLSCSEDLKNLQVFLGFFTDFPLQTNRLSLLDESGKEVFFKVGTNKIQRIEYSIGEMFLTKDTDNDGLDDEEEIIYKTDPKKYDTDGDYYPDGEEVNYGWLATNSDPSPGQILRTEYPEDIDLLPSQGIQQHQKNYSLVGNGFIGSVFENLLKKIGLSISGEDKISFLSIFLFTVFLGFLHALGPGHAKGILGSILVEKNTTFLSGIRFISIFSIVHILDILVLFLILKFLLSYFDPGSLLGFIQQGTSLIVVSLGVYLLYRAFFSSEIREGPITEKASRKKITLLAVITGLAPCSFGWSLFFLLVSLGKISWIPFLILAIGIGIFLCLLVILGLGMYMRNISMKRFPIISTLSHRISAALIFLVGMYLVITNFMYT